MDKKEEILQFICNLTGIGSTTINNNYKWVISAMDQYASLITSEKDKRIAELERGWVKVEDGLPKADITVEVFIPTRRLLDGESDYSECISLGFIDTDGDWNILYHDGNMLRCYQSREVTHWMPLPPPAPSVTNKID